MQRVAAIVPNYNHARFLPERFRSILEQSRGVDELIVLDDASRDDSHAVIQSCLAGTPHRYLRNATNSGSTFRQWRRGAELSEADLLWFAESDDVAETGFLEACLEPFQRHADLGLAFVHSSNIDDHGRFLGSTRDYLHHYIPHRPLDHSFILEGIEVINRMLILRNIVMNASAAVVRRDLFLALSADLEQFRFSGDWLLWLRVAQRARIAYIADPLNRFRHHPRKVSRTAACDGTLERENLRVLREMRRDARIHRDGINRSERQILRELIQSQSPSGSSLNRRQRFSLLIRLTGLQPRTPLHLLANAGQQLLTPHCRGVSSLRIRLGLGQRLRAWRRSWRKKPS